MYKELTSEIVNNLMTVIGTNPCNPETVPYSIEYNIDKIDGYHRAKEYVKKYAEPGNLEFKDILLSVYDNTNVRLCTLYQVAVVLLILSNYDNNNAPRKHLGALEEELKRWEIDRR